MGRLELEHHLQQIWAQKRFSALNLKERHLNSPVQSCRAPFLKNVSRRSSAATSDLTEAAANAAFDRR